MGHYHIESELAKRVAQRLKFRAIQSEEVESFKIGDHVIWKFGRNAPGRIDRLAEDAALVTFFSPEDIKEFGQEKFIPFYELEYDRAS